MSDPRRWLATWACLQLLAASQAQAQSEPEPEPEPAQSISLPDLLRHAASDPPSVLVAFAQLEHARAAHGYAQASWLPALAAQGGAGYSYDNRLILPGIPRIDSQSLDLRASLTLEWAALDAARSARIDAGEAAERAFEFALEAARRKSMLLAAELYVRAIAASAQVKDAELSLSRRSQQHRATVDLVNAGTRSPVDAQRAKIEVLSAEYALSLRRSEEQAAFAALASALGRPATEPVRPVAGSAAFGPLAANPERARALAATHRPELRGAASKLMAARSERDVASAERLPTFGVSGTASLSYLDVRKGEGIDGHQYGAAAGVYLRWRGLDPAVWGKRALAETAAQQVARERDALTHAVTTEAVGAYYAFQRAQIDSQRAVAVLEAAEVAREAQNGRYLAGLSSLLELLDAEDLAQQARQRGIEARRDEAIASARLAFACGTLTR